MILVFIKTLQEIPIFTTPIIKIMADKDTVFSKKQFINIKGTLIDVSKPSVMGIVNITPDSFYSGSRFIQIDDILNRVNQIISEGSNFIDIGAYSSRPGAENIDDKEEKNRLKPALDAISKQFPNVIISLDTFRSNIAEWAVNEFGVGIINDISGGSLDSNMFKTIGKLKTPYILMHMRGTPQDMKLHTNYANVAKEVITELSGKVNALNEIGVSDIIIDPGFGFAKTIEQNFELLQKLNAFQMFELPILVGLSRKSMIYKSLEVTPEDSLTGTIALNTIALLKGAQILRVHDVKEACQTIKLVQLLNKN